MMSPIHDYLTLNIVIITSSFGDLAEPWRRALILILALTGEYRYYTTISL